ncbi:MAG: ankyrin repeat domain-containing protein, partial [Nitrospinae bacterium]|nr:ankyrin repeat domain-containing protein [Nitrospinota bacterium]
GQNALFYAASKGQIQMAQLLIELGLDVNSRDQNKNTPLFYAVGNGELNMVQWLVEHGADLNATNDDEKTPKGVVWKHRDMTKLLWELGAR